IVLAETRLHGIVPPTTSPTSSISVGSSSTTRMRGGDFFVFDSAALVTTGAILSPSKAKDEEEGRRMNLKSQISNLRTYPSAFIRHPFFTTAPRAARPSSPASPPAPRPGAAR